MGAAGLVAQAGGGVSSAVQGGAIVTTRLRAAMALILVSVIATVTV